LLLAGCGVNGDFGRVRPSLVSDDIHAWVGPAATGSIGLPASAYALTDDERLLRDLAFPLIQPPYDRQRWYSVLSEYGAGLTQQPDDANFDLTAYGRWLGEQYHRSATGRYAQLVEDIRNDIVRIEPFCTTSARVADMDRKRHKSMAYVVALSEDERINAVQRMRENASVIRWVQRSLRQRADSFRFTLERLVIATPSPDAVEAERSLTQLRQRISANCAGLAPQIPARVAVNPGSAAGIPLPGGEAPPAVSK